jgi:hypothetical protein
VRQARELRAAGLWTCFEIVSGALHPPKCLTGLFTSERICDHHIAAETDPRLSGGRGSELLVDTAALYQLHLPARRHSFLKRYRPQACATCPKRQPVRYHNAVLNRGLTSDPVMTYYYRKKYATPNRSQTRHKLHTTAYSS